MQKGIQHGKHTTAATTCKTGTRHQISAHLNATLISALSSSVSCGFIHTRGQHGAIVCVQHAGLRISCPTSESRSLRVLKRLPTAMAVEWPRQSQRQMGVRTGIARVRTMVVVRSFSVFCADLRANWAWRELERTMARFGFGPQRSGWPGLFVDDRPRTRVVNRPRTRVFRLIHGSEAET
ncbi:hypothetical protein C8F01DRAFT_1142685 [Mycena amicta]|nr:hypothetical protein C8F01DRAFT_1142685 [Mycena amicta]